MGMDLVLAWMVLPERAVDWQAMERWVDEATPDALLLADPGGVYYSDEPEDGRAFWVQQLVDFKELIGSLDTDHQWRDSEVIPVRGIRLLVCGGSTWGDDPGDGFHCLSTMLDWPDLLRAGGFDA